jgi:hypothetical protein
MDLLRAMRIASPYICDRENQAWPKAECTLRTQYRWNMDFSGTGTTGSPSGVTGGGTRSWGLKEN